MDFKRNEQSRGWRPERLSPEKAAAAAAIIAEADASYADVFTSYGRMRAALVTESQPSVDPSWHGAFEYSPAQHDPALYGSAAVQAAQTPQFEAAANPASEYKENWQADVEPVAAGTVGLYTEDSYQAPAYLEPDTPPDDGDAQERVQQARMALDRLYSEDTN